jgi:hypothetical protein
MLINMKLEAKNNDFYLFIKKFSEDMGMPLSEVLINSRLIKILEEMFTETLKQNGDKSI